MTFSALLDVNVTVPVALADILLVAGIVLGDDPDDRHVAAAAIRGSAEVVVTANLTHFPAEAMATLGLDAVSPDDLLLDLVDLDEPAMVRAIWSQASAKSRPPTPPAAILDALARSGVPSFAMRMRPLVG